MGVRRATGECQAGARASVPRGSPGAGWEGEEAERGEGCEGTSLTSLRRSPSGAGEVRDPGWVRWQLKHSQTWGASNWKAEGSLTVVWRAMGGATGVAPELNWNVTGMRCL